MVQSVMTTTSLDAAVALPLRESRYPVLGQHTHGCQQHQKSLLALSVAASPLTKAAI